MCVIFWDGEFGYLVLYVVGCCVCVWNVWCIVMMCDVLWCVVVRCCVCGCVCDDVCCGKSGCVRCVCVVWRCGLMWEVDVSDVVGVYVWGVGGWGGVVVVFWLCDGDGEDDWLVFVVEEWDGGWGDIFVVCGELMGEEGVYGT